ncbi:hypothetical protein HYALB_00010926 [Hymenoscyphus albidus]|uniref:Uncharacterized protein n=1 Tax=Hymenoscyphus albidus TaxID=595503 RepID=A0A9N9LCH2_9HELO|nr:hypothetical protein HYALB_00010926 [Hymenoscyphus albidus]
MNSPSASSATLSIHSDEDLDPVPAVNQVNLVPHESEHDDGEEPTFRPPEPYLYPVDQESVSPSMRAASNPDQRILKAVLSKGFELYEEISRNAPSLPRHNYFGKFEDHTRILKWPSEYSCHAIRSRGRSFVGITSPLMEAICARLPTNVRISLEAGANPNGTPYSINDDYAALFLRFRPSLQRLRLG